MLVMTSWWQSAPASEIPYDTSLDIINHESKKKREEEMKVLERETRERVKTEYRKGNEKDKGSKQRSPPHT
ncbi:hypothetical protein Tco_0075937 [Tanacetum coccineum]